MTLPYTVAQAAQRVGSKPPKPKRSQQLVIRPKRRRAGKCHATIEDAVAAGDPGKATYIPLRLTKPIRQCDVVWRHENEPASTDA